ncbi:caspase-1-A isoform X2 [Dermatophagoides farinae]|uniref:caspase-1-A isoform X2 n=1 Tax=Dermatophagoides farinae TaxID=6954 RepID=UPI003F6265FB
MRKCQKYFVIYSIVIFWTIGVKIIVSIYNMTNPNTRPGYCLIINNEKFETIDNRTGSNTDVTKLCDAFERLNFKVETRSNLSKDEMLDLMKQLNEDDSLKNYDIFMLIVMSHGYSSHFMTVDEKYLKYKEIEDNFSHKKCPQLKNKPKIIIYNCCREAITDKIAKQINEQSSERQESIDDGIKDMIVIYSTLENYLSVRDEEQGTFFANALVQSLNEFKDTDLDKIIQHANKLLIEMSQNESNHIERRQVIEWRKIGITKYIYFKTS